MESMVGAKDASVPHRHQEGHHRRHHQKPRHSPHKDVIGVRRCGKTTILYHLKNSRKRFLKINPDISHIFLMRYSRKTDGCDGSGRFTTQKIPQAHLQASFQRYKMLYNAIVTYKYIQKKELLPWSQRSR
ncbi:MAG: hypothetical protein MPEBLZ_01563 [Candidatus Methanoperedens nitroreducens]|uniref:Uncharacterized protein n=1 Tax=Candidatus Methanoperedens nitratireducens TaxID=1392998 RepID=A0A0P7ZJ80_9EURY|nr:MAG: hypothetical protein MPEBLZ_01563 [Candidatus Methanoperedens sp. BLZ1]